MTKQEYGAQMDPEMEARWETCKQVHYAEDGDRPDINKHIAVPEDIREKYEHTRDNIIMNRKYFGIIGLELALGLHFVLEEGLVKLIAWSITAASMLVTYLLYLRAAEKAGSADIQAEYVASCIQPVVSKIDPDITASPVMERFPLYGETLYGEAGSTVDENTQKLQEMIEGHPFLKGLKSVSDKYIGTPEYKEFGRFLTQARVLPDRTSDVNVTLSMDSLQKNREGFSMVNITGTKISIGDGDKGIPSKKVLFDGSVLAVRMKHHVRCDVSMFTSEKSLIGREGSNGYRKVKNTIDTENEEFNENFEVDAAEESQAFMVLSPVVMENLLRLKETYGNFGLYIHDDFLVFGMNYGKQPLSMPKTPQDAKKLSLEQSILDTEQLLHDIYTIKDAVDLNFKDQAV